jgi:hypothetical protein
MVEEKARDNTPFDVQISTVSLSEVGEWANRVVVTVVTQDARSYTAFCDTGCGSDELRVAAELARYYAYEKLFNDR